MNREEKQKLVLELNKQGKTIREIAHIAHISFGDISFIIRRETGEVETTIN
jgi:transcriptional regulator